MNERLDWDIEALSWGKYIRSVDHWDIS